jgi:hypothetical protein
VQIENQQSCSPSPSCPATSGDVSAAQQHSALFPARLALARWTDGGDIPHTHSCTRHIPRAAWYAQAQRDFQSWLEAGGFHQLETDCTDSVTQKG